MAELKSDRLGFDFQYVRFEHGWVEYEFYFRWNGEPIVRDDILKRWNEYWNNRPESAFMANDYEGDGLLPLLKAVLETDKPNYWKPIEPDLIVAVYPGDYFPFLPSHMRVIWESEEIQERRAAREKLKAEMGKLPDDIYTLIVMVDAYNFTETESYYGQGLSLQLIVTRQQLQQFVDDLESEYQAFKERFSVDEWLEANH